ncbi:MAG: DUF3568 family protein [Planctomycetes bacterium]|nr:DUF3568 family protein [Planctomycetota bacterium]
MHRSPLLALGLVCALPLSGCFLAAAAAVGAAAAGAVSYEHNEAWMDFKETLPESWAATLRAMRKLGYPIAGEPQVGATEGTIEVEKTKVRVEQHPGGYVRVTARVGTFDTKDNERRAKLILEEVTNQMPIRGSAK